MTRQSLEKIQILIYLAAIANGLLVGFISPILARAMEISLWPVLGILLYATFSQMSWIHLKDAFIDVRFVSAAIVRNFAILPFVVAILAFLVPVDPAVRLGIFMVLLVPCTDWFITFTQLGGSDTRRALAFTPISLLLQIVLLPLYLWLFLGETFTVTIARREMVGAFIGLILLPLFAAFLTGKWAHRDTNRLIILDRISWFPIPLLAIVVFIIAASQVNFVVGALASLSLLPVVFVSFLILAGLIAKALAYIFNLPQDQGRVLAFSFGTRNSFVVLPLALALPSSFEVAASVIVFQSLVELIGMMTYLWWVPKRLFTLK
jgi:arsenite transporter